MKVDDSRSCVIEVKHDLKFILQPYSEQEHGVLIARVHAPYFHIIAVQAQGPLIFYAHGIVA